MPTENRAITPIRRESGCTKYLLTPYDVALRHSDVWKLFYRLEREANEGLRAELTVRDEQDRKRAVSSSRIWTVVALSYIAVFVVVAYAMSQLKWWPW